MSDRNLALTILIKAKDQATSVINGIKSSLASFAGVAAAGLGAALFKGAVEEAQALDVQMRKLEQVIKATGGAAGVTAADINNMFAGEGNAAQFRNAAAQLLTFKSVGADVFETTLRLAEDLAESGFGTLESNAVQLGKALEDPVNGLTALRRSGVSFTESQQLLITQLVETGEKAKAQGVILEAVSGQVGGVASAMEGGLAGSVEKVDASFRQIRENIGAGMLPALTVLASYLSKLSESWAGVTNSANNAGQATQGYSGAAILLAKIVGGLGLVFDVAGRYVGAYAAAVGAVLNGDFGSVNTIFKDYLADNSAAIDELTAKLDELEKPRDIAIKPTIDTSAVNAGIDETADKVTTIINQFKIWDLESTDTINNIAAELQKLSDVELQDFKTTIQQALNSGAKGGGELKKALAAIITEDVTRAWKTLGKESSQSLEKSAEAAKAAYVIIRDSGTAGAKELDKAWTVVVDKMLAAKSAITAVDEADKQRKKNISEIDSIGATPEEKLNAQRKELTDQTVAYDKAKRKGDYVEAARIAQEKEALAFESAKAETEASKAGEVASYRGYDAKQRYLRAIEDTKKALAELQKQEQTAAPKGETATNGEQTAAPQDDLSTKQDQLSNLQKVLFEINKPVNITIKDNFDEVLARADMVAKRISEINSSIPKAPAQPTGNTNQSVADVIALEALKRGSRQ